MPSPQQCATKARKVGAQTTKERKVGAHSNRPAGSLDVRIEWHVAAERTKPHPAAKACDKE
eukprot:7377770-Prymnesium_polylepis.1